MATTYLHIEIQDALAKISLYLASLTASSLPGRN